MLKAARNCEYRYLNGVDIQSGGDQMIASFVTNLQNAKRIMYKALSEKDLTQMGEEAHRLLSASRFMKINALTEILQNIEKYTINNENQHEANKYFNIFESIIDKLIPQLEEEIK